MSSGPSVPLDTVTTITNSGMEWGQVDRLGQNLLALTDGKWE